MEKNSVTKIGLLTLIVFSVLWTPPFLLGQTQPIPDSLTVQTGVPPGPTNVGAAVVGAGGGGTFYYWVVAVYQGGSVGADKPSRVTNVAVPTAGGNFVRISWKGVPGTGVTYNVLKTVGATFTGTCAACLLTNVATTFALDNAGGALAPYTLPSFNQPRLQGALAINNRDFAVPTLVFSVANSGAFKFIGNSQANNYWDGPVIVSGPALANLDLSLLTGSVQAVGSRVESNFATVTTLKGADFRATSFGGAAGTLVGAQSSATTGAGSVLLDEVYGGNWNANVNIGSATNAYGSVGSLNVAATATGITQFAIGVLGNYDDLLGVNIATNYTAAVMGAIQDRDTPGPDGAVVALLNGDAVRTAANNPVAAFKVIDRTTTPGVGFQFGFDMYFLNGAERTQPIVADIRGWNLDMLNNNVVGVWGITRGSGNLTGLNLEGVTHVNLNAWAAANGTIAYCSNCDPAVAGAGPTACTTGGASTGTVAFRLNGAWTCLGI